MPPKQKSNLPWKRVAISITVLLALAAYGFYQKRKGWREEREELAWYNQEENPSLATLRTNGLNSIYEDCSNEVVGLQRIVKVHIEYDEKDSNWWGKATCEFVNKVGGVERKDRWYLFGIITNSTGGIKNIYAHEDYDRFESDELGNPDAEYKMGMRYLKRSYAPQDLSEARRYFEKAAAQGNRAAANQLNNLPP